LFVLLLALRGDASYFVSPRNIQVVIYQSTLVGVVALGMLLVVLTGGIDLSVGSVVALGSVVATLAFREAHQRTGSLALASCAAVPAGLSLGAACGFLNGLIIAKIRVSPFVTTLGMMSAARGLALLLTERKAIGFPGGKKPGWVQELTQVHNNPLFFNMGFWVFVCLACAVALLLRYSVLGRYAYAIGSSEATARLCGVPVGRTKIAIYTLAGLLAGWASILQFASVGGEPGGNIGLELDVIAAVVIGGASLTGGQGSVAGTVVGVLLLQVLINGVQQFELPVDIRYILIGAVIVISTALSRLRQERNAD
jgi:ribose transport system permease protein